MAKAKASYVCSECGEDHPKWQGQCKSCKSWDTLMVFHIGDTKNDQRSSRLKGYAGVTSATRVKLKEVDVSEEPRIRTGIDEFDRVLGGGLVEGSAVIISGNPGAGKSTLLLQALDKLVKNVTVLYASGEESLQQIAMRSSRLKLPNAGEIEMLTETNVNNILDQAKECCCKVLVIDSIQAVYTPDCDSMPGSVTQVRESAGMLTQFAKQTGCAVMIVGHVNKDSSIAGPKTLEHMVDAVLSLEGTSDSRYRMLRSTKNRFGAVSELGCFAMVEDGLREVKNPSAIFLSRPEIPVSGSVVAVLWEGTRPLLVEIQVLTDDGGGGNSRRLTVGMDANRTSMLLAILSRHVGVVTAGTDVYINVVGGLKVTETSTDLATICAFMSSFRDRPLPQDLIVIGELGLSGELRPVPHGPERLKEAAKHGFKTAIVPKSNATKDIPGMKVYGVNTVQEAVDKLEELG
jgi:DNA repair protein RadA/Sms